MNNDIEKRVFVVKSFFINRAVAITEIRRNAELRNFQMKKRKNFLLLMSQWFLFNFIAPIWVFR